MCMVQQNAFNLKFTISHSESIITFLDTIITKNQDSSLPSGLFRKSTAGNTILHASSAHPQPLIRAIPYSQYLRLKRNCSNQESFLQEAAALRDRLLLRGYFYSILKKAFKRANAQTRCELLFGHRRRTDDSSVVRMITRFSNQHQSVKSIFNKFWHLLYADPTLRPHLSEYTMITYRRASSLKDQLVQSEFMGEFRGDPCKRRGTFTCGGCPIYRYMNTILDTILPNGRPYRPHHFFNCKTEGVVYLLTCQCQQFYVGKTKLKFHL